VVREGQGIHLTWSDPTLGIDGLPLINLDGINLYRNFEWIDVVAPGVESYIDNSVEFGGWYEYALAGFIPEGNESFEGPLSYPTGVYAGGDPDLVPIVYDDDEMDYFGIVSGSYDGNKFAVKFELPAGTDRVYTAQLMTNSTASIGVSVLENSNSRPGAVLAGPYFIQAPVAQEFFTFHFPGLDAPLIQQDSFWVVLDWPPQSPADPGIGVDGDQPYYGQSWFYTNADNWTLLASWNHMIRAGVASTISSTDPDGMPPVAHQFRLGANYPNPFNPETVIPFELSVDGEASLRIFNLLGQEVATLLNGPQVAGHHVARWDGRDSHGLSASSGIYLLRLESQGVTATRKITLLR